MKRQILVRVDGSKSIGLGHVYNMITVLHYFKNDKILVVMNNKKKLGVTKLRKHGYKIQFFNNKMELTQIIKKFNPDIMFNDILNTSKSYMRYLKKINFFIVNFEDLGQGRKFANLVFNPIYFSTKKLDNECYGEKYACVREEFRKSKLKIIKKSVRKVVITFGGTDPTNKTYHVLETIEKTNFQNIEWNVILGLGYSKRNELKNLVKKMNKKGFHIRIIEKADNISKYVKNSDFAITSNGRTVFEIASMNIPMISIAVNKREKQHSFVKYSNSGFHLDAHSYINFDKLIDYIKKMQEISVRRKFVRNMRKKDLPHGADRVFKIINQGFVNFNSKI